MNDQAPGTGGKRILLVDDDQIIRKTLSFKLNSWGYQVFTALDGSEAFNAVNEKQPHLILLDVYFQPETVHDRVNWNGFGILEWLRRGGLAKSVPVIVITASDAEEYKTRALAAGAAAFFTKPLDHDVLRATIRKTLGEDANRIPPRAQANL